MKGTQKKKKRNILVKVWRNPSNPRHPEESKTNSCIHLIKNLTWATGRKGKGCRRGWAKFDIGVRVCVYVCLLGVLPSIGKMRQGLLLVAGVTPLCMRVCVCLYLIVYCRPVKVGGVRRCWPTCSHSLYPDSKQRKTAMEMDRDGSPGRNKETKKKKKGGVYVLPSGLSALHQMTKVWYDGFEAAFSHIKCRRRLGSQLKIRDVGQRSTYQEGVLVSNLLLLAPALS